MNYWLLKSEPDTFGVHHLANAPLQTTGWNGVRNYQARNYLRDGLKPGDLAFFYHSSCKVPGIAGIVEVVKAAYPEPDAANPSSPLFDAKHSEAAPRWFQVDVRLKALFQTVISLSELKEDKQLAGMALLERSRLSVQPVEAAHWQHIMQRYQRA